MSEHAAREGEARRHTGEDVLYREKGVSALDVQRAADALLRRGRKPSVAAVREQLGGGSPNTVAPLLEQYWKALGSRLPAGPDALERVPESLARMTEALWLRSIDEARERAKAALIGASAAQKTQASLEAKVSELAAALAESRARASEIEAQLLASLRERLALRDQVRDLTALVKAEQELRATERDNAEARARDLQALRSEILGLARRRAVSRRNRIAVGEAAPPPKPSPAAASTSKRSTIAAKRPGKPARARSARRRPR